MCLSVAEACSFARCGCRLDPEICLSAAETCSGARDLCSRGPEMCLSVAETCSFARCGCSLDPEIEGLPVKRTARGPEREGPASEREIHPFERPFPPPESVSRSERGVCLCALRASRQSLEVAGKGSAGRPRGTGFANTIDG